VPGSRVVTQRPDPKPTRVPNRKSAISSRRGKELGVTAGPSRVSRGATGSRSTWSSDHERFQITSTIRLYVTLSKQKSSAARAPQGVPPTYGVFDEERFVIAGRMAFGSRDQLGGKRQS